MRVAELRDVATKAGIQVPAKMTKDRIIALLITRPDIESLIGGDDAGQETAAETGTQGDDLVSRSNRLWLGLILNTARPATRVSR